VVAGPATYMVDGQQYVSIAAGWGGAYGVNNRANDRKGPGTVYTFALDGRAKAPDFVAYQLGALIQGVPYDPAHVKEGTLIFVNYCIVCHGIPGVDRGGNIRNLGYSARDTIANLDKIVFKGPYTTNGMPDFTGRLSAADLEKIKAFIQGTADAIRPK
jgi:mono/diheme cytochrome c family protein